MFTCCHPAISPDAQIALILKTLCGFSIPEIARAFLCAEDTMNKRLVRARQKIREAEVPFEMPAGGDIQARTEAVLQAIYLLFNEGYSASTGNDLIRYELCEEAIRLAEMMAVHPAIADKSDIHALLALMLFNASRFYSRLDPEGNILPMSGQDRSKWNGDLIRKGFFYIGRSPLPGKISTYHVLAAISAQHCVSSDFASTDWPCILSLYDSLLEIDPSPIVCLNRTIALARVKGPLAALDELEKIKQQGALQTYYLFHATEGEFYMEMRRFEEAARCIQSAIDLAPLKAERHLLEKKLAACRNSF
jgi:predicted RNA polymerase sigma factor